MIAALAGLTAGGTALWHYNRGNFLYDRKLRQEQEFAIFEWRKAQAELWREDIRDIIELTEKKMDSYLVISVLQLGMCAGLFACGRLAPGTPPWLLHWYMLTLGAAFMYLLMSVWFAMHAGVAAQCASVRMLTQFVRLPVPDWHELEGARTYAHAFESLRCEDMFRVPFTPSLASGDQPITDDCGAPRFARGPGYEEWVEDKTASSSSAAASSAVRAPLSTKSIDDAEQHPDPWRMEKHGSDRGFHELQRITIEMRRHIRLARRAALQFQCFDAFSRLSMSFGTHQLLYAIAHYCLGYLSVTDGVSFPAWCVVAVMMSVSAMMMHIDFSLTRSEQFVATVVVFMGLISSSSAVHVWALQGVDSEDELTYVLPLAYGAHFCWLLNALRACGLQEHAGTGVMLPMKFRAVLYLDVFGWLTRSPASFVSLPQPPASQTPLPSEEAGRPPFERFASEDGCKSLTSEQEPCSEPSPHCGPRSSAAVGQAGSATEAANGQRHGRRHGSLIQRLFGRRPKASSSLPTVFENSHYAPVSITEATEVPVSCLRSSGRRGQSCEKRCRFNIGPSGEIGHPTDDAFEPTTYCREDEQREFEYMHDGEEIVTGQDRLRPTKTPARLFKGGTLMLSALWASALLLPLEVFHDFLAKPMVADVYVEEMDPETGRVSKEKEVHAVVASDINGLPELIPIASAPKHPMASLSHGRRLHVEWPSHSAFVPRALTCDPTGSRLVVADDFALYSGQISEARRVQELPVEAPQDGSEDGSGAAEAETGEASGSGTTAVGANTTRQVLQHLQQTRPQQPPGLAVAFGAAPRCAKLEGQAFDDISAFCEEGSSNCGVLVLHDQGKLLTECPLEEAAAAGSLGSNSSSSSIVDATTAPRLLRRSWRIARDWMEKKEKTDAVAVRSDCYGGKASRTYGIAGDDGADGERLEQGGCIVVGSTSGRVVELVNSRAQGSSVLVPSQMLLDQGNAPSIGGSITDVPGGFILALWFKTGHVSAVDRHGQHVGEWKLPEDVIWLMICAGRDHIYAIGVRKQQGGTKPPHGAEALATAGHHERRLGEGKAYSRHPEGGTDKGGGAASPRPRHSHHGDAHKSGGGNAVAKQLVELHRFPLPEELRQPRGSDTGDGADGAAGEPLEL